MPAAKPDDLSLILQAHMLEGNSSCKLFSDLYMHAIAHMLIYTHIYTMHTLIKMWEGDRGKLLFSTFSL